MSSVKKSNKPPGIFLLYFNQKLQTKKFKKVGGWFQSEIEKGLSLPNSGSEYSIG